MKFDNRAAADLPAQNDYTADLPPGVFDSVCVDIVEQKNVQRRKWKSAEMELVDLITFTFEVAGKSGTKRRVRSKPMLISTFEKSALYAFLTSWCGQPPEPGFDTDSLMACRARLTLDHASGMADPGRIYVRIVSIAPAADTGKAPAS